MFRILWICARTIVIERLSSDCYLSKEPYQIWLNGSSYKIGKKMIESIHGLEPDTDYEIELIDSNGAQKQQFHTKKEFVTLNVREFGAKGNGSTDDTVFIQCAINACPKEGRVYIPAGTYKVTSLFLKSDLRLELAKGAVLSAITDRTKIPILPGLIQSYDEKEELNLGTWEGNPLDCFSALLCGIKVSNIEITGEGMIDGCAQKGDWWIQTRQRRIAWQPRLIFLNQCESIMIEGITVCNSPSWNIHSYFSNNLRFLGLTILNPTDSKHTDGLVPESCRDIEIAGIYFSLANDCISIKSGKIYMGSKYKCPSQNIEIRQCCMKDGYGSVTIGSEMAGGVKNLTVRSCLFLHMKCGIGIKTRRGRGKDAIIDDILFEHIQMDQVITPIVINCFYFCDPDGHSEYVQSKKLLPVDERTPQIKTLIFRDLICMNCHTAAAYIYGLPEQKIQKVFIQNCTFTYAKNAIAAIPAKMDGIEEIVLLGIFARNLRELSLDHVTAEGCLGEVFLLDSIDKLIIK